MSTVHLVFKTHLDIGFTNYAADVVQTYFRKFIPQAVALAERTRDREQRFRWTTGAWLIYAYLEQASLEERRRMEAAIAAGDICWHALPFTTHSELIDESLWRFGLSYGQVLDRRFGKQTIAAKMTDVPGHTRALVPLLAEAGIRLLHIGVNPASSVPDVPPVFLWRDEQTHSDVIMIYHQTYGGLSHLEGVDDALALILTGDNEGPPSEATIAQTYQTLGTQIPAARVVASTLDDFARTLDPVRESLPVITSEIGDTWIHGVGTDPTKISRYRELSRLRREWLARDLDPASRECIDRFSHHLFIIPEHTWGMDEKTHLADHIHYRADDLAELRRTEKCRHFEASWAEQREYLTATLESLASSPLYDEAVTALDQIAPRPQSFARHNRATNGDLRTDRFELRFDPSTAVIVRLVDRQSGVVWAAQDHTLARLRYDVYGQRDYERFWNQYIRNRDDATISAWAHEDFTKPGISTVEKQTWTPIVTAAFQDSATEMVFVLAFDADAQDFGAPHQSYLRYAVTGDELHITYAWFDKPACRLPEAFWLSFEPLTEQPAGWGFEKIGQPIDPCDVVSRGARTLHAVDQCVTYKDGTHRFEVCSLDAPLVAPGAPALLDFHNRIPDMSGGIHFNLYNNVWGTNFPMWFEEDAQYRFRLSFS